MFGLIPPTSETEFLQTTEDSPVQKDDDLVILPGDKGNATCTVLLNKEDYLLKMLETLCDDSYHTLYRDPTHKLERSFGEKLKQIEGLGQGEIDEKLRKRIIPQLSHPLQVNGLLKINKPSVPHSSHCIYHPLAQSLTNWPAYFLFLSAKPTHTSITWPISLA